MKTGEVENPFSVETLLSVVGTVSASTAALVGLGVTVYSPDTSSRVVTGLLVPVVKNSLVEERVGVLWAVFWTGYRPLVERVVLELEGSGLQMCNGNYSTNYNQ